MKAPGGGRICCTSETTFARIGTRIKFSFFGTSSYYRFTHREIFAIEFEKWHVFSYSSANFCLRPRPLPKITVRITLSVFDWQFFFLSNTSSVFIASSYRLTLLQLVVGASQYWPKCFHFFVPLDLILPPTWFVVEFFRLQVVLFWFHRATLPTCPCPAFIKPVFESSNRAFGYLKKKHDVIMNFGVRAVNISGNVRREKQSLIRRHLL